MSYKNQVVEWIRNWFKENHGQTAIIGISGGKDSTIAAALCVEALGKENVVGVMMPNGEQKDFNDSIRVCEILGIKNHTINIFDSYSGLIKEIEKKIGKEVNYGIKTNLPARLRMSTLYSIACFYPGARVCNTCNRSEDYVGYSTKFGDSAGDFSPLSDLTVKEVLEIGDELGLPYDLVHKIPVDGMCGKSDEDNLGFTYSELDNYLLNDISPSSEKLEKIEHLHKINMHKLLPMPMFKKK